MHHAYCSAESSSLAVSELLLTRSELLFSLSLHIAPQFPVAFPEGSLFLVPQLLQVTDDPGFVIREAPHHTCDVEVITQMLIWFVTESVVGLQSASQSSKHLSIS